MGLSECRLGQHFCHRSSRTRPGDRHQLARGRRRARHVREVGLHVGEHGVDELAHVLHVVLHLPDDLARGIGVVLDLREHRVDIGRARGSVACDLCGRFSELVDLRALRPRRGRIGLDLLDECARLVQRGFHQGAHACLERFQRLVGLPGQDDAELVQVLVERGTELVRVTGRLFGELVEVRVGGMAGGEEMRGGLVGLGPDLVDQVAVVDVGRGAALGLRRVEQLTKLRETFVGSLVDRREVPGGVVGGRGDLVARPGNVPVQLREQITVRVDALADELGCGRDHALQTRGGVLLELPEGLRECREDFGLRQFERAERLARLDLLRVLLVLLVLLLLAHQKQPSV